MVVKTERNQFSAHGPLISIMMSLVLLLTTFRKQALYVYSLSPRGRCKWGHEAVRLDVLSLEQVISKIDT